MLSEGHDVFLFSTSMLSLRKALMMNLTPIEGVAPSFEGMPRHVVVGALRGARFFAGLCLRACWARQWGSWP